MEIRWDEKLTIDNGVIDDDHRIAIFIVNDFIHMKSHEACRERAIEIIDTLRRHMRHHFVREEAFQRSINFIDGAEHEREHAVLARRLDQITEKLESRNLHTCPASSGQRPTS
ncbi:MAG: hemerythrin family protein [Hyphomicrobiales bacterium]